LSQAYQLNGVDDDLPVMENVRDGLKSNFNPLTLLKDKVLTPVKNVLTAPFRLARAALSKAALPSTNDSQTHEELLGKLDGFGKLYYDFRTFRPGNSQYDGMKTQAQRNSELIRKCKAIFELLNRDRLNGVAASEPIEEDPSKSFFTECRTVSNSGFTRNDELTPFVGRELTPFVGGELTPFVGPELTPFVGRDAFPALPFFPFGEGREMEETDGRVSHRMNRFMNRMNRMSRMMDNMSMMSRNLQPIGRPRTWKIVMQCS